MNRHVIFELKPWNKEKNCGLRWVIMQKFKTDMNECGWRHRLKTDFCEERSAFMHKIYYKDQQMHFGFMKGILLHTDHQHVAILRVVKSKNTNVFIMSGSLHR